MTYNSGCGEISVAEALPDETALKIGEEIRAQKTNPLSPYALWRRDCLKASGGDAGKLCFHNCSGNRGCAQVNRRFDKNSFHNQI